MWIYVLSIIKVFLCVWLSLSIAYNLTKYYIENNATWFLFKLGYNHYFLTHIENKRQIPHNGLKCYIFCNQYCLISRQFTGEEPFS